jgi:fumarylacetoacetase
VESANGHPDFPIQNLPFGVFSRDHGAKRAGIAIGDSVLDLRACLDAGLLRGEAADAAAAAANLAANGFFGLGPARRQALRAAVAAILDEANGARPGLLHPASQCQMHVPAAIGDYSDFFAGINHARNTGGLFRPENPLTANYKHVPIGYHGRASSVVVSGTQIRRPSGQSKAADSAAPQFGPSQRLDYELELGIWAGPGNALGEPVPVGDAGAHIAGYCLLNDWSARDIQAWEYQPLGPFLGKSFATTVSPWVITPEALAPFRRAQPPRPPGDPAPLPYLWDAADQRAGALNIVLEVWLQTPASQAERLSASNAADLYWTPAQLLAHQTSNGCNLRPGDLLGTGTISGPGAGQAGCLLELTQGGRTPLALASGQTRRFLEDGDAVTLVARCEREGFASISFGACYGVVTGAAAVLP